MTVKRSRISRSSSTGETTALPPPFPVCNDGPFRKTEAIAENRRKKPAIFSISSPVRESIDWREEDFSPHVCGFLEKCCYCSKNIPHNADIFMYSYFRAFCSEECRQKRIDIDNDVELLCVNPRAKRVNTKQGKPGDF